MPLFNSVRRALPAAVLFTTFAFAQECWYPDGTTVSSDIPCDTSHQFSACCSGQSFCLSGGLCLTGGVVTRGSCTDRTWGSAACSGFCRTMSTDGEIAITPCSAGVSTNTFVCGLNNNDCQDSSKAFTLSSDTSLVLRPAQIQALVGPALASGLATDSSGQGGTFTAGDIIGAGCGVGIPLLLALAIAIFLFVREKRKNVSNTSAYKHLDDDTNGSIMIRPPPSLLKRVTSGSTTYTARTKGSSRRGSEIASYRTMRTASPRPLYIPQGAEVTKPPSVHSPAASLAASQRASHIPSLAERIETMRVTPQLVDVRDSNTPSRHELDSTPSTPSSQPKRMGSTEKGLYSPTEIERFELAAQRMSR